MPDIALDGLDQRLRGRLVSPTDPDYDEVRALYNGMIDKRPRLIARAPMPPMSWPRSTSAREHDLLLAIRGGGHNGPGLGSVRRRPGHRPVA